MNNCGPVSDLWRLSISMTPTVRSLKSAEPARMPFIDSVLVQSQPFCRCSAGGLARLTSDAGARFEGH